MVDEVTRRIVRMCFQVVLHSGILGLTWAGGGHVSEGLGGTRLHRDVGLGGRVHIGGGSVLHRGGGRVHIGGGSVRHRGGGRVHRGGAGDGGSVDHSEAGNRHRGGGRVHGGGAGDGGSVHHGEAGNRHRGGGRVHRAGAGDGGSVHHSEAGLRHRGGGVAVHRGSGGVLMLRGGGGMAVHRGSGGVLMHRGGGGRGGARGGPRLNGRLSGLAPRVVGRSRHVLGRLGPALTPALSLARGSNSSRGLSGRTDELLATSLHEASKRRAGKSQKSNGVDHFEKSKS